MTHSEDGSSRLAFHYGGGNSFLQLHATRITNARLFWINKKCMPDMIAAMGLGPGKDCEFEILNRYALSLTEDNVHSRKVNADYYGSSGITYFGGSGRAVSFDGIQIKGVGATPLISIYTNWFHSNGNVFLTEAIREAVYSTVMDHEFPFGTVPIWAIIDCDELISMPNGKTQSRALIIRPFVARPCHVERALAFGHSKESFHRTFHLKDILRVKEWIPLAFPNERVVETLAARLGAQCAHAHIFHWYHGGWFSSTTDTNGRLIDFGSTRNIESWLSTNYEPGEPPFGSELEYCARTIKSILTMLKRYGRYHLNGPHIVRILYDSYRSQIVKSLSSLSSNSGSIDNSAYGDFVDAFSRAQYCSSVEQALLIEHEFYEKLGVHVCSRFFNSDLSREALDREAERIEVDVNNGGSSQRAVDGLILSHVRSRTN